MRDIELVCLLLSWPSKSGVEFSMRTVNGGAGIYRSASNLVVLAYTHLSTGTFVGGNDSYCRCRGY